MNLGKIQLIGILQLDYPVHPPTRKHVIDFVEVTPDKVVVGDYIHNSYVSVKEIDKNDIDIYELMRYSYEVTSVSSEMEAIGGKTIKEWTIEINNDPYETTKWIPYPSSPTKWLARGLGTAGEKLRLIKLKFLDD